MEIEELNKIIGNKLIKIRNDAGLSQGDVAAKSEVLGVGRTLDSKAVSRIEKKPLGGDFLKLVGYLSAVGMSIEAFYELPRSEWFREDKLFMHSDRPRGLFPGPWDAHLAPGSSGV